MPIPGADACPPGAALAFFSGVARHPWRLRMASSRLSSGGASVWVYRAFSQSMEQSYGPSAGGAGSVPLIAHAKTYASASMSQSDRTGSPRSGHP